MNHSVAEPFCMQRCAEVLDVQRGNLVGPLGAEIGKNMKTPMLFSIDEVFATGRLQLLEIETADIREQLR